MKHYLFFLLLLSQTMTISQANSKFVGKAKSVVENNMVRVKVLFIHQMIGHEIAIKKNVDESYISHITAKVNDKIVFDISTSALIQKNPIIKFKFKDIDKAESMKLIVIDNINNQKEQSFKIKRTKNSTKTMSPIGNIKKKHLKNYQKIKPKVWQATKVENAIKELYGSNQYYVDKTFKDTRAIVMNGPGIIINSKEDLESIAIFSDTNERATIAMINVLKDVSIIDYQFKIKTKKSGKVIIVAKSRNGELYRFTYPVEKVMCISDGDESYLQVTIEK